MEENNVSIDEVKKLADEVIDAKIEAEEIVRNYEDLLKDIKENREEI